MSARDKYHDSVCNALKKDGWVITHDPFTIAWGAYTMHVDLGAKLVVSAEKDGRLIAVEIKGSVRTVYDLESAVGQYLVYRAVMRRAFPERALFLAVPERDFKNYYDDPLGRIVRSDYDVRLVVYDPNAEVIRQWIDTTPTEI